MFRTSPINPVDVAAAIVCNAFDYNKLQRVMIMLTRNKNVEDSRMPLVSAVNQVIQLPVQ